MKPGFPRFKQARRFRAIECLRPPSLRPHGNGRFVLRIKGLQAITLKIRRELPSLRSKFVRVTRADVGINVDLVPDGVDRLPTEATAGMQPESVRVGNDLLRA